MSQDQPAPGKPAPSFRPPDFLLPKVENPAARRRSSEPDIYLSWGGEVYGPAAAADVIAGVRAAWFEDGALYWLEGQSEWRPVSEFPAIAPKLAGKRTFAEAGPPVPGNAPAEAATDTQSGKNFKPAAPKRPKAPRIPKQTRDYRGIGIVILFVLVAVGLTVGIILLIHGFVRG